MHDLFHSVVLQLLLNAAIFFWEKSGYSQKVWMQQLPGPSFFLSAAFTAPPHRGACPEQAGL